MRLNYHHASRAGLFLCLLLSCAASTHAQTVLNVPLHRVDLPDTGLFYGAKELSFVAIAPPSGLPAAAHQVSVASLFERTAFERVWLVRYLDESEDTDYAVVPLTGVESGTPTLLKFRTVGDRSIADAEIGMRPRLADAASAQTFHCQVVISKAKVFSRPAECREGTITLKGHGYGIRVYAHSVNEPIHVLSDETVCLLDVNGDGNFAPAWRIAEPGGKVVASERLPLLSPFSIAGTRWRVAQVDSAGTSLQLEEFPGDTYATKGFKAPDVAFTDSAGSTFDLQSQKGKVVLLTFWSTQCSYCEKIRPRLNELVKRYADSPFLAVDAAVEPNMDALRPFLKATPYAGTIVPFNASLWQTYNRKRTTPVFVVIDSQGIIQLAASGASLMPVVDRMTHDLLQPH